MPDPICVYENHSGPIPTPGKGGYIWRFVAYRDAEADYNIYGYGHTPSDAIADYCRNEAEEHCANCPAGEIEGCLGPDECILTSGNLAAYVKSQLAFYMQKEGK